MDFSDCPFALWSPGELAALSPSGACSLSSFGSRSSFAGTSSFYSSAPSSACSAALSEHQFNAQTYERIYNEFRKWMTKRYSSNPDYVEADMHLFRDEWERFVRSSLRAEREHRLSLQGTRYDRRAHDSLASPHPSAAAAAAATPRKAASGKWGSRLRRLRNFWPADRRRAAP